MKVTKRIVVLGDTHFPWVDKKALKKIYAYIKEHKPDYVIQIGDLYDNYNFSRYARSYNLMTPEDEVTKGRKMAEDMWANIKKIAPNAKCYQLRGNHDERIKLRIMDKIPEIETLIDIDKLWHFKGVKTIPNEQTELFIDDLCFIHGYRGKLGDHASFNEMKTVVGHTHRAGIVFHRKKDGIIFELNAGWLGDESARVFQYTKQLRIRKGTLGFGVLEKLGGLWVPKFIPLN